MPSKGRKRASGPDPSEGFVLFMEVVYFFGGPVVRPHGRPAVRPSVRLPDRPFNVGLYYYSPQLDSFEALGTPLDHVVEKSQINSLIHGDCHKSQFWVQLSRQCPSIETAMAKRIRTLASLLWESDVEDCVDRCSSQKPDDGTTARLRMLETENSNLRAQLYQLQRENALLRMPKPTPPLVPGAKPSVVELLQTWPDQAWIQAVGDSVVGLPRLREEILPQLHGTNNGKGCILFHLCKNPKAKASAILQHALNSVLDLSKKHPAVFKIGITSNPIERWTHSKYGYALDKRENWLGMKVIAVFDTSALAAMVESFLIHKFVNTPGCRNAAAGGETASPVEGPHFTYIVYKILLPPFRVVSFAKP